MTSACAQRETLRTASDFCLNDREVKFSVAGTPGQDDPGNSFDTDQTVADLIEHNAVHRRLCEPERQRRVDARPSPLSAQAARAH